MPLPDGSAINTAAIIIVSLAGESERGESGNFKIFGTCV